MQNSLLVARGPGWWVGRMKVAERYKIPVTNKPQGCNVQHGDYKLTVLYIWKLLRELILKILQKNLLTVCSDEC